MRLSHSKIKTYRRCPKKYDYRYNQGLRVKKKAIQLERGSWIHELLQLYHDGEDWLAHHVMKHKQFYNMFEEEREDLGELPEECLRIMRAYITRYKREDKQYRVLDTELNELIPMKNGDTFNLIIDKIVEERRSGNLWIVDYKTVKNFKDADDKLQDTQLTKYHWGAEWMGYKPLAGIMFDEIRTKPPAIPELLKRGGLTRRANIDTDVATYRSAIKAHRLDEADYSDILLRIAQGGDRFFRRTYIPKDKPLTRQVMREFLMSAQAIKDSERRGYFPRHDSNECKWDCEFRDVCFTELMGGDAEPIIKMKFTRKELDLVD